MRHTTILVHFASKLVLALGLVATSSADAFEQETIEFSHSSNKSNAVNFVFNGANFTPQIDLLSKDQVRDPELRPVVKYFANLYAMNKKGEAEGILSLWNPPEREVLRSRLTDPALKWNRAQFKAISALSLNKIILYGDYIICFVAMDVPDQPTVVMKYTLLRSGENLFLTEALNGDYFYDQISHFLDRTNFESIP